MASINFSTMKTRTALRLGNMQSSDPFYSYLGDWVNTAGNRVILRALSRNPKRKESLLPELQSLWRTDATTNGVGYLAYPDDCLWLNDVYSFDSSSAADESRDQRNVVTEVGSQHVWELLDKTTSTVGYPRRWRRFSNRIQLHPVPTTAYLTKLLLVGFAKEADLSGNTDVFVMDERWHPAVVDYAVYLGADEMGWTEEAKAALEACDRKLEECISILGRENASDRGVASWVVNDPTG